MKAFLYSGLMLILLLSVFGFTQKNSDQLTQKQIDQIKVDVIAVFDSINAIYERKDLESAKKYYTSDFIAFAINGQKFNLQGVMSQYANMYENLSTYKWTTYQVDFLVITKDIVVISVDGKNDSVFKSGDKLIFDPSHYTLAYKKIDGSWKFWYQHFSGKSVK